MSQATALSEWLVATVGSAEEFATTTLGSAFTDGTADDIEFSELTGCFVGLVSTEGSVQIGLASNAPGCQRLAQALFDSSDPLEDSDVSDALGEIANILAGGVKKRVASAHPQLVIGLPIVMEGHLRLTERQQLVTKDVRLGEVAARILIISSKD